MENSENNKGYFSIEPDRNPYGLENNHQGDINMPDDNKVKFDSIFNQEDIHGLNAQPERVVGPVYPAMPPPVYPSAPAVPPQTYGRYSDSGMPPQVSYNPRKSESKKKASFASKAAIICLATMLGFATLGFGISFGGAAAKRWLPQDETARIENTVSYPEVYTYAQPTIEYSESQFTTGFNNVSEIVKKVSSAVVSINLSVSVPDFFNRMTEQPGAGSGIIFSEDDEKVYIATNNHVIQNADKVSIYIDDDTQINANFVGSDPQSDLAVISVNKPELMEAGLDYKLAEFGDSSLLQVGDNVVAIGNAMGEGKTATSGIISAINKQISIDGKTLDVIQTDAAINPGNSGGALANNKGEVIGINTAKLTSSNVEGMGYSIPSNIAKTILNDLMENGSAKKPYLGIHGISITEEMKDMYNLPSLGVYIEDVTEGGSAQKAGLEPSDIIIGFNDTKITNIDELSAAIAASNVGDTVTVYIYRRGTRPMQIEAVLGNLNPNAKF